MEAINNTAPPYGSPITFPLKELSTGRYEFWEYTRGNFSIKAKKEGYKTEYINATIAGNECHYTKTLILTAK